jgi:hypothetical protein
MTDALYAQLADALDRLPGRLPRTPSAAEIPLLRRLFTPKLTVSRTPRVVTLAGRAVRSGPSGNTSSVSSTCCRHRERPR